jgi:tetratricopeptide (TPR) repeat protein
MHRCARALALLAFVPTTMLAQSAAECVKNGRAALDANKADDAVEWFEKAVKLDDANAEHHLWLARALGTVAQQANIFRQGFLAKRVKSEFERTVQLDPQSLGGHDGLMQYYMQAPGIMGGSMDKARAEAEAMAKIAPMRGHFARASIADHEKDQTGAERAYRAAVAEFPDSIGAVSALANSLANWKRGDEAFAPLDAYLARHPGDLLATWTVGRVAAVTGKELDRGERALRTVLAAAEAGTPNLPAPANAHFRLGDIAAKRGNKDVARKEYEKALELNPKLEAAKKALKEL